MRVSLSRGRLRVVVRGDDSCPLSSDSSSWVLDRPRVVEVSDTGGGGAGADSGGRSRSVVRGGLMRVVVVEAVAEVDREVIDEKLGSTKFVGACGESPARDAYITPATTSPIAAIPAMLAPSTLPVE
ncbi:hypothetical protein MDOR_01870 [Mycolicibacterium doricum]|uniref:Uncharacterized protein n=1 Tax=Mycolicibacterium doricum TaxID=126673 RepID=A0A7I7VR88_9MYCO|nr:hypothetical protein [Mycolicibacterium doricum]MCV7267778.1 hypothetical protein [Mycolicibacterium doricum]BBZ06018.1 hypothetical protein MDOR_01870 [Mycolicibacterium doricum]